MMMVKRAALILVLLFAVPSFFAQTKKDLGRLQALEPLRGFYDSLLACGSPLSVSMLHGHVPNQVFIGGTVNKEFSTGLNDSALVNSLNRSGIGYSRFLRLVALMETTGGLSLGAVGLPGSPDYEIVIVYAYVAGAGRQTAFRYIYNQAAIAMARASSRYTELKPGIFKYSFKDF